ncbi:MAG: methyltransferase domain-containing protein [Anaerolineae bacterium]|nr:methyltransferase domain-containing protein [Anaerolineae bacterium]
MSSWTKSQVEDWLAKTDFNLYQGINLPYGLKVPGPDRGPTVDAAFVGLPIPGKSIWVVGSHYGAVPNILADLGAKQVVGYEARPKYFAIANTIAEIRGTTGVIHYVCTNAEKEMPAPHSFDYVTLFNVNHHFSFPVHSLAEIGNRAREAYLIEWATLDTYDERHDVKTLKGMRKFPIMLADKYHCWYSTESGIEEALYSCKFKSFEHKPSPKAPTRRITVCRR